MPANVKVALAVGALEENVTVVGDSALVVQTQSPSIATNLTGTQITSLPLTSRNALDSLTSLPGFNTSGTARNSTVSGLPRERDQHHARRHEHPGQLPEDDRRLLRAPDAALDSVEEVTVTTAGNTADATGQGGVQIRFVTKSGTNSWTGTAYEYLRHDALNANTWFHNRDLPPDPETGKAPKDELRQLPAGHRAGRSDPARTRRSSSSTTKSSGRRRQSTLQRVILTPEAAAGIFSYNVGGGVAAGEPAAARGRERPARDARSDRGEAARRHSAPRRNRAAACRR